MPRRHNSGPRPKSKMKKKTNSNFLGDSPAEDESEAESFHSPDSEPNQTDYGFEYTTSNVGVPAEGINRRTRTSASEHNQTTNKRDNRSSIRRSSPQSHSATSSRIPTTQPTTTKHPRKNKKPINLEERMWRQIRELQKRTDNITPKAPFGRLIRELLIQESSEATRITVTALEALQTSSEIYLTNLFADAYVCTLHRGRVTLGVHDLRLVRFLRGASDPGNRN